jgi:type I restriction enzyme S subunit
VSTGRRHHAHAERTRILDCKHRTVYFIDDGVPLASIQEVHGFEVDLTNAKRTTEEEYLEMIDGDRGPRMGDIIYSRNGTVGDAAMVRTSKRFCIGRDVCLIRAPEQNARFLLYILHSVPLLEQVESLMIGSTFRRIDVGQIKAFWICIPHPCEQHAHADFLDRETSRIDQMVAKVEEAIERLQEYRTALISAAVTGKIDVRSGERAGVGLGAS